MRKLTTLPGDRARRFADVLEAEAIEHELQDGEVWILRDSDMGAAGELLDAWQADPTAERFQKARAIAETARRIREDAARERARQQQQVDRAERPIRYGPVTILVLVASAALTFAGIPSLAAIGDSMVSLPAVDRLDWAFIDSLPIRMSEDGTPYVPLLWDVRNGQVWRLITPIFVHVGGLFHLFFNGYWLWLFGRQIETRRGSLYLLALVLVMGIASNLSQYLVGWSMIDATAAAMGEPQSFTLGPLYLGGPRGGGLSGVLYGLFGYVWAKSTFDKFSGLGVSSSTVGVLIVWLLVCFTGQVGPVANLAHLGGLVAGVLWGGVSHRLRRFW